MPETRQPIWKLAGNIGDIHPLDYSGGYIYTDETGVYPPELEWIEVISENEEKPEWRVYRLVLDRCTLHNGRLIPYGFDTRTDLPYPVDTYGEWFDESIPEVSQSSGIPPADLRAMLCSDVPVNLACAYETLAQYHGWENFDSYPLTFTDRNEIEARYQTKNN